MKIGIGASRRIIVGKKKDADRSGIGIGIIGIVRSLSIVRSKILSFLPSETALNAMVMIDMTDQIGSIRTMTADLMGRSGGELQFMIGSFRGCQYVSSGAKGESSPIGKAATTSSMMSRGVD